MSSEPFVESLSRRPLPDLIAERIMAAILNGQLQPGERLPSEPTLARQMQVGRTSLREAIGKLQMMGAVEVVRGRGTYVRQPSEDDPTVRFARWSSQEAFEVAEVLEARIGLEVTAAGLACARATDEDLSRFEEACIEHERAYIAQDLDEMVRTDEVVHSELISICHNNVVTQMYAPIVPRFKDFRRQMMSRSGTGRRSTHDHFQIHAAMVKGDPAAARQAVVAHLWTLYKEILATATADIQKKNPGYEGHEIFI